MPEQLAEYDGASDNEGKRQLPDAARAHGESAATRRRAEGAYRMYQGIYSC